MDRVKNNGSLKDRSQASAARKNPCSNSTMNKLYEQRHETGDIKFIIESEEVPAHRCVLAALSPRYKAQFYGAMAEQNTINIVDISPAAFKEFLQFFYLDEVKLTLENIEDVLNLAKQSLVDELVAECTNFLLDVVGMDKLLWCYQLAVQYQIEPVEEFCVERICADIIEIFQTQDFVNCEPAMLCQILALDLLNCDETDVFDACIFWARIKCEQNGLDADNVANLRAALDDAIFKIRFCSMTADQFANIDKKYTGLLSPQETSEIYRTIVLKAHGEKSITFGEINGKPRRPMQKILECSLNDKLPVERILQGAHWYDFISFWCSKPIDLIGFVTCNRIDDDIGVEFGTPNFKQNFPYTKSISNHETKIIFDTPIQLKANEWYRVNIVLAKLKQLGTALYGFDIGSHRIVQHDVLFNIASMDCYCINTITRLLFTITDDDSMGKRK